jgi:hypothetical protein
MFAVLARRSPGNWAENAQKTTKGDGWHASVTMTAAALDG